MPEPLQRILSGLGDGADPNAAGADEVHSACIRGNAERRTAVLDGEVHE